MTAPAQPTPGPWQVTASGYKQPRRTLYICGGDTLPGAIRPPVVATVPRVYGRETCYANARLIAAAPSLLAFVERTLDACFCDDGRDLPECARCVEARALLAEIRGR